jgi:hypothetical protein
MKPRFVIRQTFDTLYWSSHWTLRELNRKASLIPLMDGFHR